MAVLNKLEPKSVFHFFEEITQIPHGSYNLQQISDYIVKFAKDRNLEVVQDKELNVIISKPASKGYENKEPIILQGHMDMVAVSKPELNIDMTKTPLDVRTDGEYVWAEGTSLGGDDGIAVAYALAILDDDEIKHPYLEVVITTNEEVGLEGAHAIDLSNLKGNRLLNLDSECEGVLLTSCAGGGSFHSVYKLDKELVCGTSYALEIKGLLGGHSGDEIDKEHGNSNILIARLLERIACRFENNVYLKEISGGVADNAIPNNSKAVIILGDSADETVLMSIVDEVYMDVKGELEIKDPDVSFSCTMIDKGTFETGSYSSMLNLSQMILAYPCGIQAMSASIKGLVETSLNLGLISFDIAKNSVEMVFSVRSSVESSKNLLLKRLEVITAKWGVEYFLSGMYPGWAYKQHSELRNLMVRVYKDMFGKEPELQAIHAGLECGLFSEKIKDLDAISIGPDMIAIHSTGEKLSVASTKRTWDYVLEILKA